MHQVAFLIFMPLCFEDLLPYDSDNEPATVSFEQKYKHLLESDGEDCDFRICKRQKSLDNAIDNKDGDHDQCQPSTHLDGDHDDQCQPTESTLLPTIEETIVIDDGGICDDTFPDTIVDLDGLDDKNICDLDSDNGDEKTTTTTTAMTRTTTFMMIADTDSDVSMSGNIEATQSLFESDSLMQLWNRPSLSNHREVFGDTLENIKIDVSVRAQLPSDSEDDPGKNHKDKSDNDIDDAPYDSRGDDAPRRRESLSSETLVDADPDILTDQMEQAENYPGIDWSTFSEYHSLVTILDSLDEVVAGFNRPCYVGICRSPAERWAKMGSHSHVNSFRNMYVIACASKAHLNFLERKCVDHGKTQRYQLKNIASGGQPIHRATHGFLYACRG